MSATAADAAAPACPTCAAPVAGRYCARCGQRAPAVDDFTLRRFLATAWTELTDGDARTLATLRALLVPGELTRAFAAHEWRRYLPPLRLYLIASGVFFLLCWDTYYRFMSAGVDPNLLVAQVPPDKQALALAALKDPSLVERSSDYTALLRFLGVLAMGAFVALLQRGRRQPFGVHLVFATHYYVADYALFTLATPLFLLLADGSATVHLPLVGGLTLLLLVYAVLATRRVYVRGWPGALGAGVAILLVDLLLSSLAGQLGFELAIGMGMAEQEKLLQTAAGGG